MVSICFLSLSIRPFVHSMMPPVVLMLLHLHSSPVSLFCTPHLLRRPPNRTLHTNVVAVNGSLWCLETKADILVPSPLSLSDSPVLSTLGTSLLGVLKDVGLLLESALALDGKFGGHVVRCVVLVVDGEKDRKY
jgi:hypothetical protein